MLLRIFLVLMSFVMYFNPTALKKAKTLYGVLAFLSAIGLTFH